MIAHSCKSASDLPDRETYHFDCEGGFAGPDGARRLGVSRILDDECITCEERGEDLHKVNPRWLRK